MNLHLKGCMHSSYVPIKQADPIKRASIKYPCSHFYCLILLTIHFEIKVKFHFSHLNMGPGGKNGFKL